MQNTLRPVYIIDGSRTPFIKALLKPNAWSAADLGVAAAAPLLLRQPFKPQDIDEVIVGCVGPGPDEANIARIIALRLGCGHGVKAWTVQRNCASGLQAIDTAANNIAIGRHHLILAGGTECMSRASLLFQPEMVEWLAEMQSAKGILEKIALFGRFRPHFLKPVIGLLKGLTDPIVNMTMGQTAEKLVDKFNISRLAMDTYAMRSHHLAIQAHEKGYFNEITPLFDWLGNVIDFDSGVRSDSSLEKLAKLKPVFDKPFGQVTAGNSSQITDGAAFVLLASEEAVRQHNLPVLGKIIHTSWAALDPSLMGLGPVHAIAALLSKAQLKMEDIDYWEINEAFAAQVIACQEAMQDGSYCRDELGLDRPLGTIDLNRLNVDGGAIATGHPVGASGARLVLHLLEVLKRNKANKGIASLCIGGGQGGAMLLERVEGAV
jgi:acetyl-CoA C-acetyltransferase